MLVDQDFNAQRIAELGCSVPLDVAYLTEDKLKEAIHELITNAKYKENAQRIARLAKDVIRDPINVAAWWVNFVLRHPREDLRLMKPLARNLYWWQKRDLDVWSFVTVMTVLSTYVFFRICKVMLNKCFKSKKSKSTGPTAGAPIKSNGVKNGGKKND